MSVALITGASRGIGRVIAENMAKAGYDIAICYSGNESAAQETISICKKYGVQAMYVKADVSNADDVANMFSEVKSLLGPVNVLVNNAGITRDNLLPSLGEKDIEDVIDVNLKGCLFVTRSFTRNFVKNRGGNVINISSVVGLMGNKGQTNYAASKAGIVGFTKSFAKEYGRKNIRCNAIAPGYIETNMTAKLSEEMTEEMKKQIPLGRLGKPEDVAKLALFLASDQSDYITGEVIKVDGGMYV